MLRAFHAFQIAKQIHFACKTLNLADYFKDQLFRASSSVALNLAEGSGKRTEKDQRRFYFMALGSLRECEAIMELENVNDAKLLKLIDRLGAILFVLCKPTVNRTERKRHLKRQTEFIGKNSHQSKIIFMKLFKTSPTLQYVLSSRTVIRKNVE